MIWRKYCHPKVRAESMMFWGTCMFLRKKPIRVGDAVVVILKRNAKVPGCIALQQNFTGSSSSLAPEHDGMSNRQLTHTLTTIKSVGRSQMCRCEGLNQHAGDNQMDNVLLKMCGLLPCQIHFLDIYTQAYLSGKS